MISPVSMASVSNVRFGDAAEDRLSRKGAYTKDIAEMAPEATEKKSRKGKKFVTGLVIVALAAAALAILSRKNVLKAVPEEALKESKFFPKVGHYLNKAGEFIAKYTWDPAVKLWNKVFKKGAPEKPSGLLNS